jgi:hypothetical protein
MYFPLSFIVERSIKVLKTPDVNSTSQKSLGKSMSVGFKKRKSGDPNNKIS